MKAHTTAWLSFTLLLLAAPTTLAHAHVRVDLDVEADVDLHVVANAKSRASERLSFEWDWGDGARTAGAHARHAYERAGRYEIELKVTDEETGECWTERRVVRVEFDERKTREDEDADEEEDRDDEDERDDARRSRRASASASAALGHGRLGARVDVELGDASRWDHDERAGSARGDARVRAYGDAGARHTVPGAGGALGALAAAGAAALARTRRK